MIRPGPRLDEFERWYAQVHTAKRTHEEALAIFAALWRHAQLLNPDFPSSNWEEDVQPCVALARVLNAQPSRS